VGEEPERFEEGGLGGRPGTPDHSFSIGAACGASGEARARVARAATEPRAPPPPPPPETTPNTPHGTQWAFAAQELGRVKHGGCGRDEDGWRRAGGRRPGRGGRARGRLADGTPERAPGPPS
jgi:hypothetical protein